MSQNADSVIPCATISCGTASIEPFARQFEVAKLDEAWQGAVIHVVDSAVPPDRPSGPRKLFIISGGTIAGFMIGVLWALSQAGLARLKTDPLTEGKFKGLGRALTF